jgi:hypothetical protein
MTASIDAIDQGREEEMVILSPIFPFPTEVLP